MIQEAEYDHGSLIANAGLWQAPEDTQFNDGVIRKVQVMVGCNCTEAECSQSD